MTTLQATYTDRIRQEVAQTPDEYLPLLLEMIHLFRQSITLKPAEVTIYSKTEQADVSAAQIRRIVGEFRESE
jgi:hypothetical protein